MTTNFLYAQAPNRKGNQSKHTPSAGGVTAVTRPQGSTAYAAGRQGAPKVCCDPTTGNGQKVQVSRPAASYGNNDGYRSSSFLK
jgi:hypothetical protein